jgi:predicted nucleic acid-binding protein
VIGRAVFVDTSAWYALADEDDRQHGRAVRRLRRLVNLRRTLVTTNHVVGETYTLLRARLGFLAAQAFLRRVRSSPLTQRTFVPEAWEEAAEYLLAQYNDQDFWHVDATSFVGMRRLGIQEVLAFDHHFSVAGFALVEDR